MSYIFDNQKFTIFTRMVAIINITLLTSKTRKGYRHVVNSCLHFLEQGFHESGRLTSQAEWTKARGIGVGFNVEVR